ncbi:hypothetical protein FHG87_017659 [Trinorchestia longiramus]|nr:hypothetical protein FHG87_017659 [Trinorchestia longiramus]
MDVPTFVEGFHDVDKVKQLRYAQLGRTDMMYQDRESSPYACADNEFEATTKFGKTKFQKLQVTASAPC